MKFIILIVTLSVQTFAANLITPPPAPFDWTKFFGVYRFGACENSGAPIWGQCPDHCTVSVSNDPFATQERRENSLGLLRRRDGSPFAVNWDLDKINQGPFEKSSQTTGQVYGAGETFTVADGLYGFSKWHWSETDSGWDSIHLRMDEEGQVFYEATVKYASEETPRVEKCQLKRQ